MKKLVILLTVLSSWMYASAEEYTLNGIQQLARANYPAIRQFELIDRIADFSLADASSAWAPQISLSGQATYQSDVVSFPESMTDVFSMLGVDISGLHKDQYKLALNIEQTLWDGGYTKSRKEAVLAEKEVSSKSVEVELYALADKVNQLYFGILVLDEQLRLNDLTSGILEDNRKIIRSYIDNGLAKPSDLAKVDAELIANSQQRTRICSSRKAYTQVLSVMTGRELSEEDTFVRPEPVLYSDSPQSNRPELQLYDAMAASIEAGRTAVKSTLMPRFSLFAQGLYGYPGLNMFEDMMEYRWRPNFYVGVRFQWNISAFYTKRNTECRLDASVRQVELQRETFLYGNRLEQIRLNADIEQMREILEDDDRLINIRTSIREASESQLQNGTLLISDLLKDINDEHRARIDKSIHELECLKKLYEMRYTLNY